MTNHTVYFKKSDDFWALWLIISYMVFQKSDNAPLFWLIIYDFFLKYNTTGVFDQSKIGNENAGNF